MNACPTTAFEELLRRPANWRRTTIEYGLAKAGWRSKPAVGRRRENGYGAAGVSVLMRPCGERGSSWLAAPADPTRHSMRRDRLRPAGTTSTAGEQTRCGRECRPDRKATPQEVRELLEQWLRHEPAATRAMERLAELAQRAGQSDRGCRTLRPPQRLRSRTARGGLPGALSSAKEPVARGGFERYELARRAEAAGRRLEARALYTWALAADPDHRPAREALAQLDRVDAERQLEFIAHDEPWPSAAVVAHLERVGTRRQGRRRGFAFTDDAEAAGLRFVYDNAETPFHQLPEPFGGGLAILDYDGDGWLDSNT